MLGYEKNISTFILWKSIKKENKQGRLKPRVLNESDFLLGVYDEARMGALRFSLEEGGEWRGVERIWNLYNYWKWKDNDGYIPAGSIISNIEDMASYLNVFLSNEIEYSSNTYTKIKDVNANNAIYEKMNIRLDGVGMTWMFDDKNDIIWHNGATTNFNSYIGFTKDKQKGVVILSNLNPNDKISMTVIGAKILTSTNTFWLNF